MYRLRIRNLKGALLVFKTPGLLVVAAEKTGVQRVKSGERSFGLEERLQHLLLCPGECDCVYIQR